MKSIIVAGGGGLGYEVAEYIYQDISRGFLRDVVLKGVIDDQEDARIRAPIPLPYLGTIRSFVPNHNEYVVIAIGNPKVKRLVFQKLKAVGSAFFSYVHSSVYVSSSAIIGVGAIICPFCTINSGANVGDFVTVNIYSCIAHGAVVGPFSVLSPFCAMNGDSKIGEECFLGTRATLFPGKTIGKNCVVDSHSYVKFDAGDNSLITNRGKYTVLKNCL